MHSKDKGSIGEHIVITELLKAGLAVFSDVGDNARFDLIVCDTAGQLHKIQVKFYQREKSGSTFVYFHKAGPNYRFKYQQSDVDYFAIVDQDTYKVAWLKFSDFTEYSRGVTLSHQRTSRSKHMFEDYTCVPFE